MDKDKTIWELIDIIKDAVYDLRSWGSVEGQEEVCERTIEVLSEYPELRDAFSKDVEGYDKHCQAKYLTPNSPIFERKELKEGPEDLAENHDRYLIPDE